MQGAYSSSPYRKTAPVDMLDQREIDVSLARLDVVARVMDTAVRIPGTEMRFGLDAIVGLVPVVGDLITTAISSYIIYEARRLGASRWLIARMAANTTFDGIVGMIPILGDAFDLLYKANVKNLALLRRHLDSKGIVSKGIGSRADGMTIDGTASRVDR